MKTFIMTREELATTVMNGRWFAGFRYRYKRLSPDHFKVTTNYVPVGVAVMTAILEEIKELEEQVDQADARADEAWKNWDAIAYDGACDTRERLYTKLQNLRRQL